MIDEVHAVIHTTATYENGDDFAVIESVAIFKDKELAMADLQETIANFPDDTVELHTKKVQG